MVMNGKMKIFIVILIIVPLLIGILIGYKIGTISISNKVGKVSFHIKYNPNLINLETNKLMNTDEQCEDNFLYYTKHYNSKGNLYSGFCRGSLYQLGGDIIKCDCYPEIGNILIKDV